MGLCVTTIPKEVDIMGAIYRTYEWISGGVRGVTTPPEVAT